MAAPFEKFIQIANFFYNSIGIQPYRDFDKFNSRKKLLLLEFTFYIFAVNLNAHIIGQAAFIYLSFKAKTGFIECIVTAAIIGFIVVADGKMISVWYKKEVLTNLISELKKIHPRTVKEQAAYNLRTYLRQMTMVTIMFSTLFLVLTWTFNLVPVVNYIYCKVMGLKFEQHFAYNTHVPWEWRGNAWYWIINVSQNVAGYVAGAGVISSDALLCALVTLVCMHYDYIARRLEEFVPSGEQGDVQFIGSMIAYHQDVLGFSEQINSIFGIPLLLNFSASSVIICFVGFQVTCGLASEDLCKFLLYLLSALTQVYLICYYGEMMAQSSGNIAEALYNQIWYMKATTSYKKCLVCMMHRAQKPVRLQATVFLPVSINAFTEIGQLSYKFFTLLQTIYGH